MATKSIAIEYRALFAETRNDYDETRYVIFRNGNHSDENEIQLIQRIPSFTYHKLLLVQYFLFRDIFLINKPC